MRISHENTCSIYSRLEIAQDTCRVLTKPPDKKRHGILHVYFKLCAWPSATSWTLTDGYNYNNKCK